MIRQNYMADHFYKSMFYMNHYRGFIAFSTYLLIIILPSVNYSQKKNIIEEGKTEWSADYIINNINTEHQTGVRKIINKELGAVLYFDGISQGLLLEDMPIKDLECFTIEAILLMDSCGSFEQRFLHLGEVFGDRILLETRNYNAGWCIDIYTQTNGLKTTLIDDQKLHPYNKWVHVAYVVKKQQLSLYINGQPELTGQMDFKPLTKGKTSIGMRLNGNSLFKGCIYKIMITPKDLSPDRFMKL